MNQSEQMLRAKLSMRANAIKVSSALSPIVTHINKLSFYHVSLSTGY